jgi:hypothetical protein
VRALIVVLLLSCALPARADGQDHQWELGARIRGGWLTSSMIGAVAQTDSSLSTVSGGIEFVARRKTYDVVSSFDVTFLPLHDGNWLGNGHDPSLDTHYIQFGSFGQLSFVSADVSIIGHTALTRWLELRYGAGVGLGLLVGDIHLINNGSQCTQQNFRDTTQCYPRSADGSVNITLNQPDTQAKLNATAAPGMVDTAGTPHYHVTDDKPPVMIVINAQVGLRFYVHRHLAFDVDFGFRDLIFFGAGFHAVW